MLGKLSTDNKFLVFCVIEEVKVVNLGSRISVVCIKFCIKI